MSTEPRATATDSVILGGPSPSDGRHTAGPRLGLIALEISKRTCRGGLVYHFSAMMVLNNWGEQPGKALSRCRKGIAR